MVVNVREEEEVCDDEGEDKEGKYWEERGREEG